MGESWLAGKGKLENTVLGQASPYHKEQHSWNRSILWQAWEIGFLCQHTNHPLGTASVVYSLSSVSIHGPELAIQMYSQESNTLPSKYCFLLQEMMMAALTLDLGIVFKRNNACVAYFFLVFKNRLQSKGFMYVIYTITLCLYPSLVPSVLWIFLTQTQISSLHLNCSK